VNGGDSLSFDCSGIDWTALSRLARIQL